MKAVIAALAALVSWGGCGPSNHEVHISDSEALDAPHVISRLHSGPLRATYLGRISRYDRTWFERQGVGDVFPRVHTQSPQVGVMRAEASMCRVSEDARIIRCAPSFGIVRYGAAAHLGPNGWLALAREGGEKSSFAVDLLHGRAFTLPEGHEPCSASVELDGSARVHGRGRILRIDAKGELVDSVELPRRTWHGDMLGPWLVHVDGDVYRARYVHRSGPIALGEEHELGLHEGIDQKDLPACWGFGHTAVRLPSSTAILSDDPAEAARIVPTRQLTEGVWKPRRTEIECTREGFITSTAVLIEGSPQPRLEERCNPSGCTRHELRLPPHYRVSAPLGSRTIALGLDDATVVMKVGAPEELAQAPEEPLFDRRNWQQAEVDVIALGDAALVFTMLHNSQRFEAIPGPDTNYDVFVLRVGADGTVESVEIEGEPSRNYLRR